MKFKDNYVDVIEQLLQVDPVSKTFQLGTFQQFLENAVEFTGTEASLIAKEVSSIRAKPSKGKWKKSLLKKLNQESLEADPSGVLNELDCALITNRWRQPKFPYRDFLFELNRIEGLFDSVHDFYDDLVLVYKNGSFIFKWQGKTPNFFNNDCHAIWAIDDED